VLGQERKERGGYHGILKWVDGENDVEREILFHFAIALPLEFFQIFLIKQEV
jgi:hypothetical protein